MRRALALYAALSAAVLTVAGLAGAGAAVFAPERLEAAWRAALDPSGPGDGRLSAEREEFRKRVAEFEESRRKREEELRRLDVIARAALARAQAERAAAEALKREAEALAAGPGAGGAGADEFQRQLDLLQRMEPATALEVLRPWTDAQVARAMRAMRPTAGAAIADAMRADAAWTARLGRIFAPGAP